MITFNGVSLEQVAPVKIVDVHVSPIKMTATARERPIAWGADYVRLRGGSRTVSIDFALLTMERSKRQDELAAIVRWARTDEPKKLTISERRGQYLEVICTALPEPSLRQWWESKLRIVFTTMDNPYWTSNAEKTVTCGTAFVALGDAPPLMRIERTLNAATTATQTYSNGSQSMAFSQLPAGKLVIDVSKQLATVTSGTTVTNVMQYYTFGSTFLMPRSGTQTISGTGSVYWRERWS